MQNPKNPHHDAVKEEKGCRLAIGKSWMGQAEQSIQHVCSLAGLKQVRDWEKRPVKFKPYYKTLLSENLGTHCREWPAGKTNAKVQMLVEANSKPHDIVIYTDGSVTVKQGGRTVQEDSGAHRVTTSSLTMEVEAVTHAIQWLTSQRDSQITHAIILTDSMNLLQRWNLEWTAPTGTQPCTVFGCKDFCRSTVLGTPESAGMNGQIDWQAQQISRLVCSLAGQRCSEA